MLVEMKAALKETLWGENAKHFKYLIRVVQKRVFLQMSRRLQRAIPFTS